MKKPQPEQSGINTFYESALHAGLKAWYAQAGDRLEAPLDGYVIDILRDDLLIEVQTRNFAALKPKISHLLPKYRLRLVHPIPQTRWIIKLGSDGRQSSRRRSPKKGHLLHVFSELVYVADFMPHPNFSLEVLLTTDEEIRIDDGRGSWRRQGWSIQDRRLRSVEARHLFQQPQDFLALLPADLPLHFTTHDLSQYSQQNKRLMGRMAYALRQMGVIQQVGKQGNAFVYCISG